MKPVIYTGEYVMHSIASDRNVAGSFDEMRITESSVSCQMVEYDYRLACVMRGSKRRYVGGWRNDESNEVGRAKCRLIKDGAGFFLHGECTIEDDDYVWYGHIYPSEVRNTGKQAKSQRR